MNECQELFYNQLLRKISEYVDGLELKNVMCELSQIISMYEITQKCTDVVEYSDIPDSLKAYIVTKKIEGTAETTLSVYSYTLGDFFQNVRKPINDITVNDIRVYLYYHQKQSNCSDRTLNTVRAHLSSFFKWANENGYVQQNPCVTLKKIKYAKTQRESLSEIDMEKIRNGCANKRDKAIIEFLFSTGCRVSELTNVKVQDVRFSDGEVTLFGKGSKERTSYINSRCEIALKEYLDIRKGESEYLFVSNIKPYKQLQRRIVERMLSELGDRVGTEQHVYPHLIRHTTATVAIQRGMNVTEIQRMLGHENVETTMIYARTSDAMVKNSHKKCIV